ncbi:MAG: SDR family NAD(P)-dependent oxidoreductase [Planctomycetota bacterium]|nr:SDR family NAD(P)-dependent oxidoreductase [Planctomycetota bacterium]
MDLQLQGKTALITGSTLGIGFASAAALRADGASVIVNGRTQQRVDAAVEKLRAIPGPGNVRGVAIDLATPTGAEGMLRAFPTVDILVNNLGIFEPKPFLETPDEDWQRFFDTNVMSGVRLTRAYLPAMLKNNWGRVVFISSESGLQTPAEMVHYGMTKSAQIAIARGIAELTAGTGVTVNSILPGPTASEGVADFVRAFAARQNQSSAEFEREFFRTARPTSLLKRFQTPEEIAAFVALVCSPRGSGVNGSALRVDGGVVRSAF